VFASLQCYSSAHVHAVPASQQVSAILQSARQSDNHGPPEQQHSLWLSFVVTNMDTKLQTVTVYKKARRNYSMSLITREISSVWTDR